MLLKNNFPGTKTDKTEKQQNIINPELAEIAKTEDRTFLASWLFLIGSLIFMLDGILELTEGISIHAIFHNLASLLFTIGSILFMPTEKNN
ncbi:MAG: hypothetical protein ACRC06_06935 [Waterburya sp.]